MLRPSDETPSLFCRFLLFQNEYISATALNSERETAEGQSSLWPKFGETVCTCIHKVGALKMSEIRWRLSGPDVVEILDNVVFLSLRRIGHENVAVTASVSSMQTSSIASPNNRGTRRNELFRWPSRSEI